MQAVAKTQGSSSVVAVSPGVNRDYGDLWASGGEETETTNRRAQLEGLRARSMSAPIIWDDAP